MLPWASTAGKETHPWKVLTKGLYFRYSDPAVPEGTVSGNPTTASWLMTARRSIGDPNTPEARAMPDRS